MNPADQRPLEVLVVEDQRRARMEMVRLLTAQPAVRVVGEAPDLVTARRILAHVRPHAVFLDMELSPGRGTDLLPDIHGETKVILVTASRQFAVEAFGFEALDYLVKPVDEPRLAATLGRLRRAVGANQPAAPQAPKDDAGIQFRDGRTLHRVDAAAVASVEADGYLTRITLAGGVHHLIHRSIQEWCTLLPDPPFVRLSRSLIVNRDRVDSLSTLDRNQSVLRLKDVPTPLQLGRTAGTNLRALLRRSPLVR